MWRQAGSKSLCNANYYGITTLLDLLFQGLSQARYYWAISGIRLHKEVLFVHTLYECEYFPDSKIQGANMGPIWGREDPSGPHVGPMNFAIWEGTDKWVNG